MVERTNPRGTRVLACWLSVALLVVPGCGGDEGADPPAKKPLVCGPSTVAEGDRCAPAGIPPERCSPGFEPDGASGCVAVLPPEACGPGTMAVPGETACHPVQPCSEAPFGDAPDMANTVYVDVNYSGAPDGSSSKPFPTLQEAVDAAPAGGTVAIAAGEYDDVLVRHKAVTLWGRCPELVTIHAASRGIFVHDGASGSAVRGLSITGPGVGFSTYGSAEVALDHVWLHDLGGLGVDVEGAEGAAHVTIADALIESASDVGALVAGASLDLQRTVVRNTRPGGYEQAPAVVAQSDFAMPARVAATGSILENSLMIGVLCIDAEIVLEATLLRGTQGKDGTVEVFAQEGGKLELRGSLIQADPPIDGGVKAAGVQVRGAALVMDASRVTGARLGVLAEDDAERGAIVTITMSTIDHSVVRGLAMQGGVVSLERALVLDTEPVRQVDGVGIDARPSDFMGDTHLSLVSSRVEGAHTVGIITSGAPIELRESAVVGTVADIVEGAHGDGLVVLGRPEAAGSTLATVVDSRFEKSARAGILNLGGRVELSGTEFACNAIDIDGEPYDNVEPDFAEPAPNLCGCDKLEPNCAVQSVMLTAPEL